MAHAAPQSLRMQAGTHRLMVLHIDQGDAYRAALVAIDYANRTAGSRAALAELIDQALALCNVECNELTRQHREASQAAQSQHYPDEDQDAA